MLRVLADVAQLVEHLICNQAVKGSSPFISSIKANKFFIGMSTIVFFGWSLKPPVL